MSATIAEGASSEFEASGSGDDGSSPATRSPADISRKQWKAILKGTLARMTRDRVTLLAAGVAFFGLLAVVPALVAMVSLYGLIGDPAQVQRRVDSMMGAAPREARQLVTTQLRSIVESSGGTVGLGLVIGILIALWSASSGMKHLVDAGNAAYGENETRGYLKLRLLAGVMTICGIAFLVASVWVIAVLPKTLSHTALGTPARIVIEVLRWPMLAALLLVALAVVYRYSPDRAEPRWSWVSPGALAATALWLIGSLLFSIYTANFGKFDQTYGSLGAVIVAMLWMYLTTFLIIAGAELNAETEEAAHC